ncbi:MAG: hypothetical protein IRY87_00540 [Acetobacteraceae bacterium]|nr:hypothetical protein [Acetobacteraceae bacterium]
MAEQDATGSGTVPEAAARFVIIIQGTAPKASIVEGIEGVKDALLQHLWKEPGAAVLDQAANLIGSIEDPAAWAVHGAGDGRPFWHWWLGYEGGSVTVQRLTEPLPPRLDNDLLRSAIADAANALAACAQDLRQLAGTDAGVYVFTSQRSGG